MKRPAYIKLT